MIDFESKPLRRTATLGERLREIRSEQRVSVAEAAQATAVPEHHLEALETGAYDRLPGDVYTRNFLRRYAKFLQLNEESVLRRYDDERSVLKPTERRLPSPIHFPPGVSLTLLAKRMSIGLFIIAILVYLVLELSKIVSPPSLVLESPAESVVTKDNRFEVRGRTDPEATVLINGQPVFVGTDGSFREVVTLNPGRNTIQVTAAKNRGKRYTITRDIILEGETAERRTTSTVQPSPQSMS